MVAVIVLVLGAAPGAAPGIGILDGSGEALGMAPAQDSPMLPGADLQSAAVSVVSDEIVVDVAGAVVSPGLHRLRAGDRVGDAIKAAGGFAPRVDLAETSRALNLAQPLADGTKVLVPELGFEQSLPGTVDDGRIDINRADQAELETLPGIGPVTAGKILAARADGRFDAVKELRSRGLVGESVYAQIKDMVRAGR
ncbi:MAG: helix-hairpin-helix domain-containing protein [Chloroflexota bacterium]